MKDSSIDNQMGLLVCEAYNRLLIRLAKTDKLSPYLLADVGGQLGLFLGSSLLTYVEFLDCLAMVVYTRYFHARR